MVWLRKAEGFSDISGVPYLVSRLHLHVLLHVAVHTQLMVQVSSSLNPRNVNSIQLEVHWLRVLHYLPQRIPHKSAAFAP